MFSRIVMSILNAEPLPSPLFVPVPPIEDFERVLEPRSPPARASVRQRKCVRVFGSVATIAEKNTANLAHYRSAPPRNHCKHVNTYLRTASLRSMRPRLTDSHRYRYVSIFTRFGALRGDDYRRTVDWFK